MLVLQCVPEKVRELKGYLEMTAYAKLGPSWGPKLQLSALCQVGVEMNVGAPSVGLLYRDAKNEAEAQFAGCREANSRPSWISSNGEIKRSLPCDRASMRRAAPLRFQESAPHEARHHLGGVRVLCKHRSGGEAGGERGEALHEPRIPSPSSSQVL